MNLVRFGVVGIRVPVSWPLQAARVKVLKEPQCLCGVCLPLFVTPSRRPSDSPVADLLQWGAKRSGRNVVVTAVTGREI